MSDEHGMTRQDYEDHAIAYESIEIELRDGKLVLGFGRDPAHPEGRKDPIRLAMSYGQAQALSKALGIGMAKLRVERAGRRDGA